MELLRNSGSELTAKGAGRGPLRQGKPGLLSSLHRRKPWGAEEEEGAGGILRRQLEMD